MSFRTQSSFTRKARIQKLIEAVADRLGVVLLLGLGLATAAATAGVG